MQALLGKLTGAPLQVAGRPPRLAWMTPSICRASPAEDEILVRHYRALWRSYEVPDIHIRPDAEDATREFIRAGRARFQMAAFVAELEGKTVGSAACQLHNLPYPDVTVPTFRKYGYIWSVYVEPAARRQRIARALVAAAVDYLRSIGCTKAVLHSSDAGEELYRGMGFIHAKEMRLDL